MYVQLCVSVGVYDGCGYGYTGVSIQLCSTHLNIYTWTCVCVIVYEFIGFMNVVMDVVMSMTM